MTRRYEVVFIALVAAALAGSLAALDAAASPLGLVDLVQPGSHGPAAALVADDFPDADLLDDTGLDGQQFYAMARHPWDLEEAAEHLDRPRYRWQRPLLSWLGWLGHPTGGGTGLVVSLFVANLLGVALLAAAVADTTRRLGGTPAVGLAVPLLPGVWWSLRYTVADALAVALALAAVALQLRGRRGLAAAAAGAAVLAKETAVLIVIGAALGARRGDRMRWFPAVAAAVTTGLLWAVALRVLLPGSESVTELSIPFAGLRDAIADRWLQGHELRGLLGAVSALGITLAALWRRGYRHPLTPAILVQLAFLTLADGDVLGNDFGAGRAFLPLLTLSLIALCSPGEPAPDRLNAADRPGPARTHLRGGAAPRPG